MIGLKQGIVKLFPYSKDWAIEFEREKKRLHILNGNFISIEHIGSTSIPGIKAKPVIDVVIGVKSVKREGRKCVKILNKSPGYYERPKHFPKTRFFVTKGNENRQTHYVHIVRYKGDIWNSLLLFRDYLRRHKDVLKQYEQLKLALAVQYGGNRAIYTKKKSKFINNTLKKARK